MQYAQTVVQLFSVLTVLGQAILLVLLIMMFAARNSSFLAWVRSHALWLMLITALLATGGSLFFSDVAMWNPCKLCWYQRIFMYPQVVLLLIALWKKDTSVAKYILALSLIGGVIAGYHYSEHLMAHLFPEAVDPNVPCDTSGESCRFTPFFHFGYITIPMMALTVFALNALGSVLVLRKR